MFDDYFLYASCSASLFMHALLGLFVLSFQQAVHIRVAASSSRILLSTKPAPIGLVTQAASAAKSAGAVIVAKPQQKRPTSELVAQKTMLAKSVPIVPANQKLSAQQKPDAKKTVAAPKQAELKKVASTPVVPKQAEKKELPVAKQMQAASAVPVQQQPPASVAAHVSSQSTVATDLQQQSEVAPLYSSLVALQLQRDIADRWVPPSCMGDETYCVARGRLDQQGNVNELVVVESSGILFYNVSVTDVLASVSLPRWAAGRSIIVRAYGERMDLEIT